jgi:hypothetical protein
LSIVPPCCGCGWHSTATPRGGSARRPGVVVDRALGVPAGRRWTRRARWRRSSADVGRQQQALDDAAVLQVRLDDLVDVAWSTKVYQVSSG